MQALLRQRRSLERDSASRPGVHRTLTRIVTGPPRPRWQWHPPLTLAGVLVRHLRSTSPVTAA